MLFKTNQLINNRLSLLSVYFETFLYYDRILTFIIIPIQLLIFIFKYNVLYYTTNVIAGQIILLVLAYFLNIWRVYLGSVGNRGKKYGSIIGYFILDVLILVGFIYIIAIQTNILWLQFITFLIAIILNGVEILLMIFLSISYKINE